MTTTRLANKVRRIGHLDIPGGGQVVVRGDYAFVGHMKPPHGTTVIDISDRRRPKVAAGVELADRFSHTHKVRVAGDLMITNVEQNDRHFLRKGEQLPVLRARLSEQLGRAPGRFGAHQFREKLDSTLVYLTWFSGGLRIVDVADPFHPEEVGFFIPDPVGNEPSPQSNDVDVGDDGLIYLIDRNRGFDILEFEQ